MFNRGGIVLLCGVRRSWQSRQGQDHRVQGALKPMFFSAPIFLVPRFCQS